MKLTQQALAVALLLATSPLAVARQGSVFHQPVQPEHSHQVYKVTDLGPLAPTAINTWGQVVGNLNGHAFMWTKFRGLKGLGTLTGGASSYAASINDLGVVTGTADGPGTVFVDGTPIQECSDLTQPFVWTPKKGMQGLGTVQGSWDDLPPNLPCSIPFYATGINALGQVVGYTAVAPNLFQWGFLWTPADGMTLFGGSWPPTFANGVSITGQIVGETSIPGPFEGHATSWVSGVGTDLGTLGGESDCYTSSANGVNDLGQVVGWSTTVPLCDPPGGISTMHAALWTRSGAIQDLGTLPGDAFSAASKINFFGIAIGSSGNTISFVLEGLPKVIGRAFIWSELSGMRDLNTLIPANSGWVLNSASGINIWGQIVGSGTLNGQPHGFLLTPRILFQF